MEPKAGIGHYRDGRKASADQYPLQLMLMLTACFPVLHKTQTDGTETVIQLWCESSTQSVSQEFLSFKDDKNLQDNQYKETCNIL